jgi:acyl CoA:acetate/3-ketoacid CoA transferase beta subunit
LPTQCSNFVTGRPITLHAENGFLGYGPFLEAGTRTWISTTPAGSSSPRCPAPRSSIPRIPSRWRAGARRQDRARRFQVAENGDLANWKAPHQRAGGAMDLAVGGGEVIVLMYHTTKMRESKPVSECSHPITALARRKW